MLRPKGIDVWGDGGRVVSGASLTLEEAATFAELGFDVIADPFDLEELTRYEQIERSRR